MFQSFIVVSLGRFTMKDQDESETFPMPKCYVPVKKGLLEEVQFGPKDQLNQDDATEEKTVKDVTFRPPHIDKVNYNKSN